MRYKITANEIGARIDSFLSEKLSISRSQIQKLIKSERVLINDAPTKNKYAVKEGDTVQVLDESLEEIKAEKSIEPNTKIKLDIVFEDEHILIINKPSGILVHPTEKYEPDTIVNALLAKYPEIKNIGEGPMRPGIVHRIDKLASGLLIITKKQKAFDYFKKLFKSRKIYKEYTALVHGVMEDPSGTIDLQLERHKESGRMVARPKSQEKGKEAITEYEVIQNFDHFSLLKVVIKTGRTHQIRAHFNALNHPVVGDPLYKQKKVKQHIELDRIFLHAKKLGFNHITGEKISLEAPLPKELQETLKTIK